MRASVKGFATALETIAGKTAVEIVGTGTGIDEALIPQLGWLREFGVVSPVIEAGGAGRRRRQAAVAAADGGGQDSRRRYPPG